MSKKAENQPSAEIQEQEVQQFVSLPLEVVNATLNYLASKPFAEVQNLIQTIQKEAKVID